jgi:hypothetical protein
MSTLNYDHSHPTSHHHHHKMIHLERFRFLDLPWRNDTPLSKAMVMVPGDLLACQSPGLILQHGV